MKTDDELYAENVIENTIEHWDIYSLNGPWTNPAGIAIGLITVLFCQGDNLAEVMRFPSSILGSTENIRFEDGVGYFGDWCQFKADKIAVVYRVPKVQTADEPVLVEA